MRNPAVTLDSCISFHAGHRANPRAVRSMMARPTLWVPADIEVMMSMAQGMTLHVFAGGAHHQVFAHDLDEIAHLVRIAPKPAPGASVGRVNFHNGAIALPADPRHSAGLRYFSFAAEPLSPCVFERDEELGRDFEALTAEVQRTR